MLWTLGTAIALGFYRALALGGEEHNERITALSQVFGLIYSLPTGARIGGLLLFVLKHVRGERGFPSQPGQWLLVIEGLSAVVSWTGRAIALLFTQNPSEVLVTLSAALIPNCLVATVAYGVALFYVRSESRLWKVAIWALILQHAASLFTIGVVVISGALSFPSFPGEFFWLYSTQAMCFLAALTIFIPLAAVQDPLRRERDFLHWTGVVTFLCSAALALAAPFLFRLVR